MMFWSKVEDIQKIVAKESENEAEKQWELEGHMVHANEKVL